MPRTAQLSELSAARQSLVRLCQSIDYGQIRDLLVANREPKLCLKSIAFLGIKLDSEEFPRPEPRTEEFTLCAEVIRWMELLDAIENGTISKLEVRAGIPRRVIFEKQITNLDGVSV